MAATYQLRKHLASMAAADKPEAVAERLRYNVAAAHAREDAKELFPEITPENFTAACAYQDERLAFWIANPGVTQ